MAIGYVALLAAAVGVFALHGTHDRNPDPLGTFGKIYATLGSGGIDAAALPFG
jgi:hypothetical protein